MADIQLYFDGLCEPAYAGGPRNPGGIGCYGYVIYRDGEVIDTGMGTVGTGVTNNRAEYAALMNGLSRLIELGYEGEAIEVLGDSKLVIEQVSGRWRINKPHLQTYVDAVRKLLARFPSWSLSWVPREKNEQADELSQQAYEKATGLKVIEYRKPLPTPGAAR